VALVANYTDGSNEGFKDPTLGADRRAAFEFAVSAWSEQSARSPRHSAARQDPSAGPVCLEMDSVFRAVAAHVAVQSAETTAEDEFFSRDLDDAVFDWRDAELEAVIQELSKHQNRSKGHELESAR